MVTADHGLAGARYAENYSVLHHFHLDLKDVKAFAVCEPKIGAKAKGMF